MPSGRRLGRPAPRLGPVFFATLLAFALPSISQSDDSAIETPAVLVVAASSQDHGAGTRIAQSRIFESPRDRSQRHQVRRVVVLSDEQGVRTALEPFGRGYLGIEVSHLTRDLRTFFGASTDAGLLVSRVEAGGAAAEAGIEVGDVLTHAQGERLETRHDLVRVVRPQSEGSEVDLELIRDRSAMTIAVQIKERSRVEVDILEVLPNSPLWQNARPGHARARATRRIEIDADGKHLELGDAELIEAVEALRSVLTSPDLSTEVDAIDQDKSEIEQRMAELERQLEALKQKIDALPER